MKKIHISTVGFNLQWILFLVLFLILNLNVQWSCAEIQWSSASPESPPQIEERMEDGDGDGGNDENSGEPGEPVDFQEQVAKAIKAHKETSRSNAGFSSIAQRYAYNLGYNTAYNYIYNLAYQAGYYNGHATGYQTGHTTGYNGGHTVGYNQGFDMGYIRRGRK